MRALKTSSNAIEKFVQKPKQEIPKRLPTTPPICTGRLLKDWTGKTTTYFGKPFSRSAVSVAPATVS